MLQETCLLWTQAGWSKSEPLPGPYTTLRANRISPPGGHRGLAAHLSLQLCRHLPKGSLDCGSQYTWSGGHAVSSLWWPPLPGGLTAHGSSAAMDQTTVPQKEAGDTKPLQLKSGASPPSRIHKTAGSQQQGRCGSSPGKTKTSHTCVTFLRESSGSP